MAALSDKHGESPSWDVSQERAFIENLLNQRFHFFLLFVSVLIAGALSLRDAYALQAILLTGGTIVCVALASTISRAQDKLDALLKIIFEGQEHPATVADKMVGPGSRRRLIGYTLPTFFSMVIALGALYAWAAVLWSWFPLVCEISP